MVCWTKACTLLGLQLVHRLTSQSAAGIIQLQFSRSEMCKTGMNTLGYAVEHFPLGCSKQSRKVIDDWRASCSFRIFHLLFISFFLWIKGNRPAFWTHLACWPLGERHPCRRYCDVLYTTNLKICRGDALDGLGPQRPQVFFSRFLGSVMNDMWYDDLNDLKPLNALCCSPDFSLHVAKAARMLFIWNLKPSSKSWVRSLSEPVPQDQVPNLETKRARHGVWPLAMSCNNYFSGHQGECWTRQIRQRLVLMN